MRGDKTGDAIVYPQAEVKPGTSWSAFALKQKFAWEVSAQQIKRTTQQETMKEIKKLKLAA
jgi:hypothetical protein